MKEYGHLTIDEREEIAILHAKGLGVRAIGREINRHHSTISREIKKVEGEYRATKAQAIYESNRKNSKRKLIFEEDLEARDYAEYKLSEDKSAASIVRAFKRAFKGIPKEYLKTITVDNGKEFAGFKEVEKELAVEIYFCSPYSPWEKGSNENFNGILRQFYPKKTDFKEVSKISLMRTVELIRERPRKILDYFTANEIFWDRVKWCA